MIDHLINIVKYNLWANRRIVKLIKKYPEELIHRNITNSFSSILKTIAHIWSAEKIWLMRMAGQSMPSFPKLFGSSDQQLESGLKVSEAYLEFVKGKTEEFLLSLYIYRDTQDTEFSIPIQEIIHHTMNHST